MKTDLKVLKFIKQHDLIHFGDKILVGVSGGPDSMALLHILFQLRHEFGLRLHVVHFNHQLRNSARLDQKHVQIFSKRLGLPCSTIKLTFNQKMKKGSLEDIARQQRLCHFLRILKKERGHSVALGHQMDDCAETVLMKMLRGSGLQGLGGIQPLNLINGITVIRPLLAVSREEVIAYLKNQKIAFRHDETNFQDIYTRNKIRNKLIPYLENHYQNNLRQHLYNLAQTVSADYEYLETEAKKYFERLAVKITSDKIELQRSKLYRLPISLRRLVLRLAVLRLKVNMDQLSFAKTLQMDEYLIEEVPAPKLNLLPKLCLFKNANVLTLQRIP
jgi:tRNA(Ile)-lysidine synthase